MKVRVIVRAMKRDGWYLERRKGSHRQFRHDTKRNRITISRRRGRCAAARSGPDAPRGRAVTDQGRPAPPHHQTGEQTVIVPPGFFKEGETIEMDPMTEAVEVGYAAGYRVLYTQYQGKWHAHTMDLRAVFGGGDTLEAAKRNMAEAVAFHLEDLPEDQFIAPAEPARQAVAS